MMHNPMTQVHVLSTKIIDNTQQKTKLIVIDQSCTGYRVAHGEIVLNTRGAITAGRRIIPDI